MIGAGSLCTFFAVAIYGASHSVFASRWFKKLVHERLQPASARYYRLAYNIVAVLTFLPVLGIAAARPGQVLYRIPFPYHLLTLLGQAIAVVLVLVGLLQTDPWRFLGLGQLFEPPHKGPQELVIHGLYRWVRHPLYAAGLLFIWLTPLMTTSVLTLNVALTLYIYLGSIFEERRLLVEFGQAYESYRRRVPRLVPIPGRYVPRETG